jgi:hypothetical protein
MIQKMIKNVKLQRKWDEVTAVSFKTLSQHLYRASDEDGEEPKSGYPISRQRFDMAVS